MRGESKEGEKEQARESARQGKSARGKTKESAQESARARERARERGRKKGEKGERTRQAHTREHARTQVANQIAKDVPRCHIYEPLIASALGRQHLDLVLRAWVAHNSNTSLARADVTSSASLASHLSQSAVPSSCYWQVMLLLLLCLYDALRHPILNHAVPKTINTAPKKFCG